MDAFARHELNETLAGSLESLAASRVCHDSAATELLLQDQFLMQRHQAVVTCSVALQDQQRRI